MTLLDTIRADQVRLRKVQRTSSTDYSVVISVLTTLIGEASAVGKNQQRETTDAETIAVVKKFIKNNDEFIAVAPDDGTIKPLLQAENDWLQQYLPTQLTESDLSTIITAVIGEGANNTGAIMKVLKERYDGQYDGKTASTLVKQLLG